MSESSPKSIATTEGKSNFILASLPRFAIPTCTLTSPPQFLYADLLLIPLLKIFVSGSPILADRSAAMLCADCSWQVD